MQNTQKCANVHGKPIPHKLSHQTSRFEDGVFSFLLLLQEHKSRTEAYAKCTVLLANISSRTHISVNFMPIYPSFSLPLADAICTAKGRKINQTNKKTLKKKSSHTHPFQQTRKDHRIVISDQKKKKKQKRP